MLVERVFGCFLSLGLCSLCCYICAFFKTINYET